MSPSRTALRFVVALSAAAASCISVGPDYSPREAKPPTAWREPRNAALASRDAELDSWWRRFDDPVLDGLIERAGRGNLDLRESLERVRESRAIRGGSAAQAWPSLDASGSYQRRGESDNTQFGSFIDDTDQFTTGFDASWELDLWGRVRRSVEAADADFAAAVEDARAVSVTVAAETAANYVQLRAFRRRLEIARTNVQLQEATLALVEARFDAGLVGERDLAQARWNLSATRARLPVLEVGERAAENRLAVLLGVAPGTLAADLEAAGPIPVPPPEIAVGVPADLLRRRADVRRAERQLAAETARIGMAEGDLYPRLTLLGSLGLASESISDLAEGGSTFFGLGPSMRWSVFDGGRLRERVAAQDARAAGALARWERTVLSALEESENAMTSFAREQARRVSLVAAATQARRAVELAQTQYGEGLSDFQPVLDSQRALAELEDVLAQNDASIATSLITLYKSLGGGWEGERDPLKLAAR